MGLRTALLILVFLASAAGLWWANSSPQPKPSAPRVAPYDLVKAKVIGARGRVSDESGKLLYRYQAAKAVHSGSDGEVALDNVSLNYYPLDDQGKPSAEWLLKAPVGTLSADRQSLLLEAPENDTVLMQRLDINPPQIVRAPKMVLRPHDYTATGNQSITLSAGESNVRADAFELKFSEDIMLLRQNVRGHYEP